MFKNARRICFGLIATLLTTTAFAAPRLRCEITQSDLNASYQFAPVADPYRVEAIDINGNFRFKAVVIGDATHVDYVKLYTYHLAGTRPVLLHEAVYTAPQAQPHPAIDALSGTTFVYSPALERELKYACALFEVTP